LKRVNEELSKLLEHAIESDERMAGELAALQSWADKFMKSVDEQRHAIKMAVDTQSDHMMSELQVFKARIDDAVSQLRGRTIEHEKEDTKIAKLPNKHIAKGE